VTGNSFDAGTRQNVKKRIADILYLESPPADAVKLAYVASKEPIPDNILYLGDNSDAIHANARSSAVEELTGTRTPVDVSNKNFLITQVFSETTNGTIPLYYKHVLSETTDPSSVRVLDKNLAEVTQDKYLVEMRYEYNEDTGVALSSYEECHVYNSLESSFNQKTGEYEAYFIQYTDASGTTTTLLNNEPAYTEATTEDIWALTLGPKPWKRVYLLSESLSLRLGSDGKFSILYLDDSRVRVDEPAAIDNSLPWFVRVTNGSFTGARSGVDSELVSVSTKYHIPEFSNQAFSPIEPYKRAVRVPVTKVADNLLKLPHKDIVTDNTSLPIDVVMENDGVVQYAITSDPTKAGSQYTDISGSPVVNDLGATVTWSYSDFVGIDGRIGFVASNIKIKDSWDSYAWYTYEENYYELTGLNMNPLFDPDAILQTRAVYLVPESIANDNLGVQEASIQWVKVSTSGVIESCSQDGTGNNININQDVALHDLNGYKISNAVGLHYNWRATTTTSAMRTISPGGRLPLNSTSSFPKTGWARVKDSNNEWRYFDFIEKTSSELVLGQNVPAIIAIPNDSDVELVNFIDEFTVNTSRDLSDELQAYTPFATDNTDFPNVFCGYFVLADLSINQPHSKEDATVIDIRENGGGIIEDLYDEAKQLNAEAQWMSDMTPFDGQLYPGRGAVVVKLPVSIKETFTEEQIERIVEDNIAYGTKPLIRYYGYQPRIELVSSSPIHPMFSFITGHTMMTILWERMGSEFTYDIWMATSTDGPWAKINRTRIVDQTTTYEYIGDYNLYSIYGLEEGRNYAVRITCYDKYYHWWYSYSNYASISGGAGASGNTPTAPFGNSVGLLLTVGS
jgi:hypothetical protein